MEGVGEEKALGEGEEAGEEGEEEGEEAENELEKEKEREQKEGRKESEKEKEEEQEAELTFLLHDTGSPGITEETESPLGARADRETQGGVHQTASGLD